MRDDHVTILSSISTAARLCRRICLNWLCAIWRAARADEVLAQLVDGGWRLELQASTASSASPWVRLLDGGGDLELGAALRMLHINWTTDSGPPVGEPECDRSLETLLMPLRLLELGDCAAPLRRQRSCAAARFGYGTPLTGEIDRGVDGGGWGSSGWAEIGGVRVRPLWDQIEVALLLNRTAQGGTPRRAAALGLLSSALSLCPSACIGVSLCAAVC
eukprot:SAG11_NODE_5324_length_1595_cov_1.394385_3_plen_218_part_00